MVSAQSLFQPSMKIAFPGVDDCTWFVWKAYRELRDYRNLVVKELLYPELMIQSEFANFVELTYLLGMNPVCIYVFSRALKFLEETPLLKRLR